MNFRKLSIRLMVILTITAMSSFAVSAQKSGTATPVPEGETPTEVPTGDVGGEVDSGVLTLPILLDGEPIELSFEGSDGAVLAVFNATEGDSVSISMTSTSDIDPYLVILAYDGTPIAVDDDSGEASLDSLIADFEVPFSDTYFILATTFASNGSSDPDANADQTFELMIEGNTQPEGLAEDEFSYEVYGVAMGDAYDVEISEEAPTYFIDFAGEEGQSVTIDAPSDELDTLLMLFDFSGRRIATDDDGGDVSLAAHIETELPETGSYFLMLTTYDYDFIASGDADPSTGIVAFSIE